MSIWSSYPDIGETDTDGTPDGTVLRYTASHVFPDPTHGPATIGLATIPAWCTPGHRHDETTGALAEYLRLDLQPDGQVTKATVVLTVDGATKLRDDLTGWLDRDKVTPWGAST